MRSGAILCRFACLPCESGGQDRVIPAPLASKVLPVEPEHVAATSNSAEAGSFCGGVQRQLKTLFDDGVCRASTGLRLGQRTAAGLRGRMTFREPESS